MAPSSNILAGKCHGQRGLAGCCPWDHKSLDVTEHVIKMNSELRFEAYLWIAFIYFYISIFFFKRDF